MADYDQIMKALRNAHAAGDSVAAKRLAAMAKAAKSVPVEQAPMDAGSQSVPAMPLPENPQLQTAGPGPTGRIDPALMDQGILPRRFVEGQPQAASEPESVTAADGTKLFRNSSGGYSSREMMAANMRPSAGQAALAGAAQGFTLGFGDEVAGAVMGEGTKERSRAMLEASRRDRGGMTLAGEVAGVVANPLFRGKATGTLKQGVIEGAKVGAMAGAAYATGSAEGNAIDRLPEGFEGAVSGGIFGAAAPLVVNIGTKTFRSVFKAGAERPTLESLKAAKTVAYKAVDDAGERFNGAETQALLDKVTAAMDDVNYVPGVDTQTDAALRLLERNAGKELSLGQLDKLRQNLFQRYNSAKNEVGLLEAIDAIDEVVTSRTATSELLDAARLSNARYKKAEVLDLAFKKATDQTASTGSGGNILNKYRQAVTSIINNPKQARWFSPDEISTMREFVRGSKGQNTMRLIGKLAPSGNGLMTALNLGAVSMGGPGMLAVSAGASGAKAIADRGTERAAQGLIAKVSGAAQPGPAPINYRNSLNALAGVLPQDR